MSHATGTAQHSSLHSTVARAAGLLIALLTAVIADLLAKPGSWSDLTLGFDTRTVYPLMVVPAIAIVFAAGVIAACHPAVARVAAVISVIMGVQVAGIAVVASRDWLNWSGAGFVTYEGGSIGSRLATTTAMVAGATIAAGIVLYLCGPDRRQALVVQPGMILAGATVAIAVPILLCTVLHKPALIAAGQFALWWSLSWGVGLVAAGTLHTTAARRAALFCVAASVVLNLVCVAISPLYGFGLSLPSGNNG